MKINHQQKKDMMKRKNQRHAGKYFPKNEINISLEIVH